MGMKRKDRDIIEEESSSDDKSDKGKGKGGEGKKKKSRKGNKGINAGEKEDKSNGKTLEERVKKTNEMVVKKEIEQSHRDKEKNLGNLDSENKGNREEPMVLEITEDKEPIRRRKHKRR